MNLFEWVGIILFGLGFLGLIWSFVHRPKQATIPNDARLLQAVQYLARGSSKDAVEGLKQINQNQGDLATGLALGTLLRRNGDVLKAIRLHRHQLAQPGLEPELRGFVLTELGADFLDSGLFERSQKALQEAKMLLGAHPWFCDMALPLFVRMGDFDAACHLLEECQAEYDIDTTHKTCLLRLEQGIRLLDKKDFDGAESIFKSALSSDPQSVSAGIHYAKALRKQGRQEQAKHFLVQHKGWLIDQPWLYFRELRQTRAALAEESIFEQEIHDFLEQVEDDWRVLHQAGLFYADREENDVAFSYFMKAFHVSPQQLIIHQSIWALLLTTDKKEPFFEEYTQGVNQDWFSLAPYTCNECGYSQTKLFWYCPACHQFETCHERRV